MVKHKRIARLSRIAVIVILVVALCLACISPGYAVIAEASIIVPAVIAALAAFGIGTSVSAMQSGDIISWYTQKLEQWALSVGQSVSVLLDVAKITTDPLGLLRLAPSFLINVKAFAQWLQTNMGITEAGSPVVNRVGNFSDMPIPSGGYAQTVNAAKFNSGFLVYETTTLKYSVLSNNSFNASVYCFAYLNGSRYNVVGCAPSGNSAGYYTMMYSSGTYSNDRSGTLANTNSTYQLIYTNVAQISDTTTSHYKVPIFSSLETGLAAVRSYLNGNGQSITLTPDSVIDYPDTTGDDEEDLPYVIDYGGEAGDTVQDAADTVMQKVISNDLVVDGAVETPPQEMEWADIMSPRAVNGLDDIFPFCIPFDVYHFFQAMIATPTAPHFEVPFVVPGLVNYTFILDFAQFNTVAQIFRTMELLCFCIGLALATRRLIRG